MTTGVKMSLRLFATLALLIGLFMWIFNINEQTASLMTTLVAIHITCAVLVLLLSITVLFLPVPAGGNIRTLQRLTVLLALCTMLVGYLQLIGVIDGLVAPLLHLILALAVVSMIETTLARQKRLTQASKRNLSMNAEAPTK
ncbi:MAG TPA: hypothetical protein VKV20_17000 [Ktedonobacteraceae bacterium]|nr:hypothetical protein [Ktedonobacteraceae bacterium]